MSDNTDPRLFDVYGDMLDAMQNLMKNKENVTAADVNAVWAVLKAHGISSIRRPGNKLDEAASAAEQLEIEKFPFAVNAPILPKDDPAVKAAGSQ